MLITQGRANAPGGRFWVGYQFEVRPGVGNDFEVVDGNGSISVSGDGWSMSSDSRYETRELGFFQLYETELGRFTRAEVYNLRRDHQFSGYPVYWAGRATNEESLNYLKPMIDANPTEINRLGDRAAFAIALHDDARVEPLLIEIIRKPVSDSIRSRAIFWLGYTPESQTKNAFLADIVRSTQESTEARQQAMSALAMSRAPGTLSVLENFYDTMTSRELKRRALSGIARNDNRDAAANFLIRVAQNDSDKDLRKECHRRTGRVAGEKSLGALTATLDSNPTSSYRNKQWWLSAAGPGRGGPDPDSHGPQSSEGGNPQDRDSNARAPEMSAPSGCFRSFSRNKSTRLRAASRGKHEWNYVDSRRFFDDQPGRKPSGTKL
jgi:hypothetical protein